jgi:C1A family cysteine protease
MTAGIPRPTPDHPTFGWQPDLPDIRDYRYAAVRTMATARLPAHTYLLGPRMSGVYDQGQLGSCTANAIAAAVDYTRVKQGKPFLYPSRLFIYYNERKMRGWENADTGAYIRDGMKSVATQGACPESLWQYQIQRFRMQPEDRCYAEAEKFQTLQYRRLDNTNLSELKACLAEGFPFVFGFTVYDYFITDEMMFKGILNMPKPGEKVLGGHAVMACGYLESEKRFLVRNSWGSGWGLRRNLGYFTIPYEYITNANLADDFWTITQEE